jgi:ATP/maltotriose-dependent transcriptional regulator MalT
MGDTKAAAALVRKNWRDLTKGKVQITILLGHLTVTGHAGLLEHAQEVADYITAHTKDARVVSQVYRVQAEIALENLQIHEAEALTRKAAHITMNAAPVHRPFILAQLENVLAICAWAFGDYNEALSRIRRLHDSRVTPLHIRRVAAELEINIRVWLRDVPGALRALKAFGSCSVSVLNTEGFARRMDIYRLRCLLLKKSQGVELSAAERKKLKALSRQVSSRSGAAGDPESGLVRAVCIYLARGKKDLIKDFAGKLASGKRMRGGAPLCALPDFLEAVREAGLWDARLERWKSRAIEKGVLNFNMLRPEE